MRTDFGVIVISHGRPECTTYHILRGKHYTGKLFVLIDDEDSDKDAYLERYGDSVRIFHKQVNFDIMDNFDGPNGIATFSRNECWNVAEREGLKYFLIMDDDLQSITFRYEQDGHLRNRSVKNIDPVFEAYCDLMDSTNLDCTGFGSPSEFMGGLEQFKKNRYRRWTCSSYFLRTSSRFDFVARYSEDGITPIMQSQRGKIFLRVIDVMPSYDAWSPSHPEDNKVKHGGCQDAYAGNNGYAMRFYMVMGAPDCVKVALRDNGGWRSSKRDRNCWPEIVSGRFRKVAE